MVPSTRNGYPDVRGYIVPVQTESGEGAGVGFKTPYVRENTRLVVLPSDPLSNQLTGDSTLVNSPAPSIDLVSHSA